ncbi:unnamed protein product [Didymodactylos carnosus]|uniref:DNA helicase n=1 Tax=Didymodactylos carnosus TaxID=1234261 RepID=A0A813XFI7_9BILA|nr:unnamed protein product [Didymodactylos carnosus]CAF0864063.1 unnamed protein product [Didymodactylos carnosus]CAF3607476.1 unnamed protein product [Didymodactylos carnosus]CAF3651617.1 unnamed protein product [Didymodactylos carnosus]
MLKDENDVALGNATDSEVEESNSVQDEDEVDYIECNESIILENTAATVSSSISVVTSPNVAITASIRSPGNEKKEQKLQNTQTVIDLLQDDDDDDEDQIALTQRISIQRKAQLELSEEESDEDLSEPEVNSDEEEDSDEDYKKRKTTTKRKSTTTISKRKAVTRQQVARSKTTTTTICSSQLLSTTNRKRQRTSSLKNYASTIKKTRSSSCTKRKIRRTAASNCINYHESSDDEDSDSYSQQHQQQAHNFNKDDDSTGSNEDHYKRKHSSSSHSDLITNTSQRQTKVRSPENLILSGSDTALLDESQSETIEKVLKVRLGKKGETGPSTTVYNTDECGMNQEYNEQVQIESDEEQYLIKWKNWSYLHNTWESRLSLEQAHVKGLKVVDNYVKLYEQTQNWRNTTANIEEIESYECEQEQNEQSLVRYQQVERIIAHEKNRKDDTTMLDSYDYLCKWDLLPYSECTWEDGTLILERFPLKIDEYNQRQHTQVEENKTTTSSNRIRTRPRFIQIQQQPTYLVPNSKDQEFKLRDYQLEGLNWLVHSWSKSNSVILADEMGLGKTIQTISFLSYIFKEHHVHGPFLIVVPLSTIQGWQQEFLRWSPSEMNTIVYIGDMLSREKIRQYEFYSTGKNLKFHTLITTYDFLLKDKQFLNSIQWAILMVDEAHRLKNDDSVLYRTLIQFNSQHRILITGTPLQNSLKELWSLLYFIMPHYFDDWTKFDLKYSSLLSTNNTNLVQRSTELHKELEPFLLRRIKRDVEKSLPAKVEQILRVEMTRVQKQYYKWILTKNYRALTNERGGALPSFINIMMELKKCANHAFFVKRNDEDTVTLDEIIKGSGKLLLLDKLLIKLRESNHRVLIFSQMVKMLNILAEYCALRRFPFQRLDGSMTSEIRRQALNNFNRENSGDFIFLLSTRAGGLGINLATADTVIIYDSDWNPQNDLQAQARAHRIGQTKQVNIYRLVAKQSVEETIIERAKQKMVLDHLVIQRMDTTGRKLFQNLNQNLTIDTTENTKTYSKEELNAIIKFGAEDLFKEKDNNLDTGEDESQKMDIDEILQRAEMRQDDTYMRNSSEDLLSQFKIANISTIEDEDDVTTKISTSKSWHDIIPEEDRLKYEQKCLDELLIFQPRNRKRVEKNNQSIDKTVENDQDEMSVTSPLTLTKDNFIHNFNSNEIRRFIKSFKKFPDALNRLDIVTMDAELEEKSRKHIEQLAQKLYQECTIAIKQDVTTPSTNTDIEQDDAPKKSCSSRSLTIRIQGVNINALQIINSIRDLEPLKKLITNTNTQSKRKTFSFPSLNVKPVHWNCPWSADDDKSLLYGIYEHGYSNWEQIKMDPELSLSSKILLNDKNRKPQSSHLQTRADYLLKLLKKYFDLIETKKKTLTTKKLKLSSSMADENRNDTGKRQKQTIKGKKEHILKSREIIDNSSEDDNKPTTRNKNRKLLHHNHKHQQRHHSKSEEQNELQSISNKTKDVQLGIKNKEIKIEDERVDNSVNDSIEYAGLEKNVFKQCKELLRPVKQWFGSLDSPEEAFDSYDDYINDFEKCLLKIGDQIQLALKQQHNEKEYHKHRQNLWTFVSKFTSKLTADDLRKRYRTALTKREENPPPKTVPASTTTSATGLSTTISTTTSKLNLTKNSVNNNLRSVKQNETYRRAGWCSKQELSSTCSPSTASSSSQSLRVSRTKMYSNNHSKDPRLKHTVSAPLPLPPSLAHTSSMQTIIGSTNAGTTNTSEGSRSLPNIYNSESNNSISNERRDSRSNTSFGTRFHNGNIDSLSSSDYRFHRDKNSDRKDNRDVKQYNGQSQCNTGNLLNKSASYPYEQRSNSYGNSNLRGQTSTPSTNTISSLSSVSMPLIQPPNSFLYNTTASDVFQTTYNQYHDLYSTQAFIPPTFIKQDQTMCLTTAMMSPSSIPTTM